MFFYRNRVLSPFSRPYSTGSSKSSTQSSTQSVTRLVQFMNASNSATVGVVSENKVLDIQTVLPPVKSVYDLFVVANKQNSTITGLLGKERSNLESKGKSYDYAQLLKSDKMLPSFSHPDPMRCFVTGTGLTHLGSTQARDQMHKKDNTNKTDSQKMFDMGVERGKPPKGQIGVQPEWFYKGNGTILRAHGQALSVPSYADDGGEEPEIAVCYFTTSAGQVHRIGYTMCNEWSDHPMEKVNYLWLAPSKLRELAIGPELIIMEHFKSFSGYCKITRNGSDIYNSGTLLTGEDNMSHSLDNIEFHHFKHEVFRYPQIASIHTLGTSKLSFPNRGAFEEGDAIEIGFEGFGHPLKNTVAKKDKPFVIKNEQFLTK